ncbi:MAG: HAD family hydrolase [Akkermansia sp.]|nr:HAD family hydrolase [Akkermansia sp.]
MLSNIKHAILDWSGTLCNDVPFSTEVFNWVRRRLGLREYSEQEWINAFCLPITKFNAAQFPNVKPERVDELYGMAYLRLEHRVTNVRPLPCAKMLLNYLQERGIDCHVFSAAQTSVVKRQAQYLGLSRYMKRIIGGQHDKANALRQYMAQAGMAPEQTLYVGDTPHDVIAGEAAHATVVAVRTGYATPAELREVHPETEVDDLGQLQALMIASEPCK